MLWVIVILLLILTFRWWVVLVAGIAAVVGPLVGWFLVVGAFFLVAVLLLCGIWPVFHWIAVALGPRVVDQVVTPLIGLMVIVLPVVGLFDSMTEWHMTKAIYQGIRSIFAFKHRTDRA